MAISEYRRNLINDLTQDIIDYFHIQIPIKNIDDVVKKIGGTVIQDDQISEYSDGFIKKTSEQSFEIVVSIHQSNGRRNFTIAHELGHLFLHMGYKINHDIWNEQINTYFRRGNTEEEYEANEFAAAFLMPKRKYKEIKETLKRHEYQYNACNI